MDVERKLYRQFKNEDNDIASRYHEYNGTWFTNDTTDKRFMEFINDAIKNHSRVEIVYKEGWEDYSGYHGGDGRHHKLYVGRSTGSIKIPLAIYSSRSMGGPALLTCDKAIESYRTLR